MPYSNKDKLREWRSTPEQKEKARERKEKQRNHEALIERLAVVQRIADRCGNLNFAGDKLQDSLRANREAVRAYIQAEDERMNSEKVEVVNGV